MTTNHHRRLAIAAQVWGNFLSPGNEHISTFFAMDHWIKGDRHSFFIHPYESLPYDESLGAAVSSFATTAVQASTSSFSGDTIDLSAIDWYFVVELRREQSAWCKVKFKAFYPENVAQIKNFPEANETSLFGDPEIKGIKSKAAAIPATDRGLTAFDYRKQHTESMHLLAQLADQLHGPVVKLGIWNPPEGLPLDNGCLTLSKEDCEFRTLFVRRDRKLLDKELSKAQNDCSDYKVLVPTTALENGFFGAVFHQHRVTTWDHSDGPKWDEKVFKESRDTKPTWRGAWRTRVHESGYLGEW